jgi:hypothetical protein
VARESLAWLETFAKAAERIDPKEADAIYEAGDAMAAQAMLRRALFG